MSSSSRLIINNLKKNILTKRICGEKQLKKKKNIKVRELK